MYTYFAVRSPLQWLEKFRRETSKRTFEEKLRIEISRAAMSYPLWQKIEHDCVLCKQLSSGRSEDRFLPNS